MDFFDFSLPFRIPIPTAWESHIYRQTVLIVLSIIFPPARLFFSSAIKTTTSCSRGRVSRAG